MRSLRGASAGFVDREPGGLPGTWSPWQLAVSGLLLVVGLALRGRLLDPRRFRARDFWRPAVVLPGAMVLGVLGVLAGFSPVAGSVVAALVVVGLVLRTQSLAQAPAPARAATSVRARTRGLPGSLGWSAAITLVLVAALAVSIHAAWHGLTGFPTLPAPLGSGLS